MLTRRSFLKRSALASMFTMLPISIIPNEVPINWNWNQTDYWSLEEPLMKLGKQVMRLTEWDYDICNEYRTKLINLYAQVKIDTRKVTKRNIGSCDITFDTKNKTIESNDILNAELTSIGWDWKRKYVQPLSKTFKLEGKDNEANNIIENLDYWYKNYEFPFGKLEQPFKSSSIPYWNLEEWKHI